MSFDREELQSETRREREALGRTIQYAKPDRWDLPSAHAGWRNGDVIAHLAASDAAAAAAIAGESTPELDEYLAAAGVEASAAGFDDNAVARRAQTPLRRIFTEWGHAADQLLVQMAKVDPDGWNTAGATWFGTELPMADFIQMRLAHWWLHGEDVRAGVNLAPRIEHPPVWAVNDISIRRLPIVLEAAGHMHYAKTLRVRVEGAGAGDWYQALAPGETAWPGNPDVVIEGNAHALALMIGRRVSADFLLDNGDLVLGGDDDLGFDVLENIRTWA